MKNLLAIGIFSVGMMFTSCDNNKKVMEEDHTTVEETVVVEKAPFKADNKSIVQDKDGKNFMTEFDSENGKVRIKYDDQVWIMDQVVSGSGSRYENGDFVYEEWQGTKKLTKGDRVIYLYDPENKLSSK